MRKTIVKIKFIATIAVAAMVFFLTSCSNSGDAANQDKVKSLEAELQKYKDNEALTNTRLIRFDSLDFEYYSKQDFKGLSISHDDNIKVFYPDGSTTVGNDPQHTDMLKPMFVFAPDTKITSHPVRFGSGDWTAVIGVMEGTFSAPMPVGGGKTIPSTNKKFKLSMSTIGHWKDGKMIEEYLFWDNYAFMKQIGLAQ